MYFGQSILNTLTIKYFKNTILNASGSVTLASGALQIGLLLLLLLVESCVLLSLKLEPAVTRGY